MGTPQDPHEPHPGFAAMCSEVEDFELLPTVKSVPTAPVPELAHEERTAPLDELILAGLVSP